MRNIKLGVENEGKTLVIRIDLTKEARVSSTGKTKILASTQGTKSVLTTRGEVGILMNVMVD
jgi:hypothetical protein